MDVERDPPEFPPALRADRIQITAMDESDEDEQDEPDELECEVSQWEETWARFPRDWVGKPVGRCSRGVAY